MLNSKEYIQLNSSFLGDWLARFIARVYVFYITNISPNKVQLLFLYVIFRSAAFLIYSFYPELGGYFSFLYSAEFNIEAFNNSFEANMAMLAGPADEVSSSNEWSANELILKASSADNGSTLGGNGSSENANSNNNGNANSNNNELRRARNFLNQVAEIVRFSGGIVMNPDLVFSESDLRHFTDSQISNRTEGLKGMLEDEQKRNDYRYVDHYLEELRKLSNEKRRREEQNSRILQALIDRANEERRR